MSTENTREQLNKIFADLNAWIDQSVKQKRAEGLPGISKAEVKILGQMSLLANEKVSAFLSLAQTGDMDALLSMENVVKQELKNLLKSHGLVYDEDSRLIWIPKGAVFDELFDFENVIVKAIDPESALVSKAVKAPAKNKQLVRQAIASGEFPGLMARIEENAGNLEFFADEE